MLLFINFFNMNDDDKFEENLNDIEPIKTQYSVFNKRYNSFFKIKNLDKLKRNIDRKKKTFDFFSLSNNENTEFKTPQNNYINYKKLIPLNHADPLYIQDKILLIAVLNY